MSKLPNKKVKCDVCLKTIRQKKFFHVMIGETNYKDVYYHLSVEFDKEFDVCNYCILLLNFRE